MAFINQSAAAEATTPAAPKPKSPSLPILTQLCYLMAGLIWVQAVYSAYMIHELANDLRPTAILVVIGTVTTGLIVAGVGQLIAYVGRIAFYSEQTALAVAHHGKIAK